LSTSNYDLIFQSGVNKYMVVTKLRN